jgi:hypothetical protein
MNRWVMTGALGLSMAALMLGQPAAEAAAQVNGAWIKDYSQARAEAKKSGKPMLVVFR